jgi:hypothetical protein
MLLQQIAKHEARHLPLTSLSLLQVTVLGPARLTPDWVGPLMHAEEKLLTLVEGEFNFTITTRQNLGGHRCSPVEVFRLQRTTLLTSE